MLFLWYIYYNLTSNLLTHPCTLITIIVIIYLKIFEFIFFDNSSTLSTDSLYNSDAGYKICYLLSYHL